MRTQPRGSHLPVASKLYLSGIEIIKIPQAVVRYDLSKLYLSGIEIERGTYSVYIKDTLNCTLVELKLRS